MESAEACSAAIAAERRSGGDLAALYLLRGEFYRGRGMLDLAFADFSEALRLRPQFAEAVYRRGLTYRDAGRFGEALTDLDRAIGTDQKNMEFRIARGSVLESLHQIERARDEYNYVVLWAREFVPGYVARGEFWLRTGDPDSAKADFDRAISLRWDAVDAVFGRGNALRQIGDLPGAIRDYAQAAKLAPGRPDYRAALDDAKKVNSDPDLAKADRDIQERKRAVAAQEAAAVAAPNPALEQERWSKQQRGQWPDSAPGGTSNIWASPFDKPSLPYQVPTQDIEQQGIAHVLKGQFSAALADFERGLALNEKSSSLHDDRGTVFLALRQFDRAKADFDRALELEPRNLDAQAHSAILLDQQGQHERALAEFDRILSANPQHIASHIGKGAVLVDIGQVERGLAEFDRALAITPNTMQVDALVARGAALALRGRFKEANADVERAAELGPDHAKAALGQAIVLVASKRLDRAITVLDRSIADGNENPLIFVLRGKALAQTGAVDRAIADFGQALKFRPDYPEALVARGSAWIKKKDYPRALEDLDHSIEMQPTATSYLIRGALYEMQGKCSLAMSDFRQARDLKPGNAIDIQAQAAAKGRLEQYAHRKSCGPVGERKLASGGWQEIL